MIKSDRQTLLRLLTATVLSSTWSPKQLQELAIDLLTDKTLGPDLGALIQAMVNILDVPTPDKISLQRRDQSPFFDLAYEAVQRRRVSKRVIIERMRQASPSYMAPEKLADVSVRDLLLSFFARTAKDDANRLLKLLGVSSDDDPYLSGITDRR